MTRNALVCLLVLFVLAGCGEQQVETPVQPGNPAQLGTYWCTSAVVDGMDLGADGQWLRLDRQGKAALFMVGEPDEAFWALTGKDFTLTMGGEVVARGTMDGDAITMELMGMDCVFRKTGVQTKPTAQTAQAESSPVEETATNGAAQASGGTAVFSCGSVYEVQYDTALFSPGTDGLTDLCSEAGTKAWFTRLTSQEDVDAWLGAFQTKLQKAQEEERAGQTVSIPVAGYTAQVLVYQEEDGWHSQVVVPFDRNLGTEEAPLYAACLTFSGVDWMGVWGQPIQDIVQSLKLIV